MKWTTDAVIEAVMRKLGVKFTVVEIDTSELLVEESLSNNARMTAPIDPEVVDTYSGIISSSPEVPWMMVVLHKRGKGYYILSGNHRVAAFIRNKIKRISAYVVHTDDELLLDTICRVANRYGSARLTTEEAKRHAVWLMERYGLTAEQAAEQFGLSVAVVVACERAKQTETRALMLGIRGELSQSQWTALSGLRAEAVFIAAAKLAVRYNLTSNKIRELCAEVKHNSRSEATQLAAVTEFAAAVAETEPDTSTAKKPRVLKRPVRTKFLNMLNGLRGFLEKRNAGRLSALQITSASEQAKVTEAIATLILYLKQLTGGKSVKRKGPKEGNGGE